jgi:hypothetical protein
LKEYNGISKLDNAIRAKILFEISQIDRLLYESKPPLLSRLSAG